MGEKISIHTKASTRKGEQLDAEITKYARNKPKIICPALNKRPVFLTKYMKSTQNRRDKTKRKQKFFAGIELLKKASVEHVVHNKNGIDIETLE